MKRRGIVIALLLIATLLLSRVAWRPERFTGIWYAADGTGTFLFREGIVERLLPEETDLPDGAYSFTKDSITLFVTDTAGLETVQTLYWMKDNENQLLTRSPNAPETALFSRNG